MDKDVPVSVWPEWKLVEKIGEGSFGKFIKRSGQNAAVLFTPPSRSYLFREVKGNWIVYGQR